MNILLLGSGGREHALAWKMSQSRLCKNLYIAPGNAGTSECGVNVNISSTDFNTQKKFCSDNIINMVVAGPEEPLVKGIYDFYKNDEALKHIIVIASSAAAAQLEGSKAFSKKFMHRHNIPTASYAEFDTNNFEEGKAYIKQHDLPVVLKADGLAAGKGVVICNTQSEALAAFEAMIIGKQFGEAGAKVVIEQFLSGIELSVFVITDGRQYKIIGEAKDYKRIGEGDTGLNTGGMGCVSPVPFADAAFIKKVEETIIIPTIKGLEKEELVYKGFIFFGLINLPAGEAGVTNEPYVIEYNCRMGDPETEVVIPLLKNDLVELFIAIENGTLDKIKIEKYERASCTIMAVSGGYPGDYKKHLLIEGLDNITMPEGSILFHAGTKQTEEGIVTNGGRVLAVTSFGETIGEAVAQSKKVLEQIHFEGMYYRRDIGFEFV